MFTRTFLFRPYKSLLQPSKTLVPRARCVEVYRLVRVDQSILAKIVILPMSFCTIRIGLGPDTVSNLKDTNVILGKTFLRGTTVHFRQRFQNALLFSSKKSAQEETKPKPRFVDLKGRLLELVIKE